ncbi:hypothetical protein BpHYR1_044791 [Brachionus plicatilis]|uniref:Uncharacterized protein n=1 Tax=Brachionus plicatilis TaxID=10195 RepID=A0A3M7PQ02_BRAPC|nr:hypothetical protein BpHYR1_044791 [Brachionus plicatilis]
MKKNYLNFTTCVVCDNQFREALGVSKSGSRKNMPSIQSNIKSESIVGISSNCSYSTSTQFQSEIQPRPSSIINLMTRKPNILDKLIYILSLRFRIDIKSTIINFWGKLIYH